MELPLNRESILKDGTVNIRVKRAGMLQIQTFIVKREKTPMGDVPYLTIDKFVDIPELMRVANEVQLPLNAKNGKIFPDGKSAKDFAGL